MTGRPRDASRIAEFVREFARAWSGFPALSAGQLFDRALDNARIVDNEFETRWLLIEDRPLQKALSSLRNEATPAREGD